MPEYSKSWLSIDEQMTKLASSGFEIEDRETCARLLRSVGYFRLTGYLYPLRVSEEVHDDDGRAGVRILNRYHPGTTTALAAQIIDFDRRLRLLVLEGVERIEVSFRSQVAHVLGRESPFAHTDPANFVLSFTESRTDNLSGESLPSRHSDWLARADARQNSSDEAFVAHFRNTYNDRLPIWALAEVLELGQLARLYGGLNREIATEIAHGYGARTKKMLMSWISSINYVRNVSAHHARLFNRKLVSSPARPSASQIPVLAHLKEADSSKQVFGLYNVLAVMAYLLRSVDGDSGWPGRVVELLATFPDTHELTASSMGVYPNWPALELWMSPAIG